LQVAWSPISPGTFLTCQAGRAVRIANYTGVACSLEAAVDPTTGAEAYHQVSRPLRAAPPWMRRRACARFGWGGRLASVRPPVGKDTTRAVLLSEVVPEPELKVHSARFEQAMEGDLSGYCQQKAAEEEEAEADYWGFIQVLLELHLPQLQEASGVMPECSNHCKDLLTFPDGHFASCNQGAKRASHAIRCGPCQTLIRCPCVAQVLLEGDNVEAAMLARLGFAGELAPPAGAAAADQVESAAAALQAAHLAAGDDAGGADDDFFDRAPGATPRGAPGTPKDTDADGDDFFNKLAEAKDTAALRTNASAVVSDSGALETGDGGVAEAEIQRFLFVGNHAAAVNTCVASERYADALVIAHISGAGKLWRATLAKYMKACPHPYLRVVDSQARSSASSPSSLTTAAAADQVVLVSLQSSCAARLEACLVVYCTSIEFFRSS
jgi:hypothetical protein